MSAISNIELDAFTRKMLVAFRIIFFKHLDGSIRVQFSDFHFDTSTLMEVYTAMGIKTDKILNHNIYE